MLFRDLARFGSGIAMGFMLKADEKVKFKVQYAVECASCDIFYRDETGRAIAKENVKGTWQYNYAGRLGHFAYVSATANKDRIAASVKIIVNGKVRDTSTSESTVISAKAGHILYNE